ncbi:uncharacterized protein FIBRA_00805 [Fibroporia radiculosa]|uniref:Alkyl hydroperoxide reductase subunit C/ Thiol specific antioxidant domain-containing protein n=1 Tax=Fibroporia radiculosa TaxID=599839 RepID=J4GIM9_9APHY|nr:uncharacterized protein FIBRA_00805 [Fibroporia radiculosa]CCL98800.1 predicted protein [Fibroporia radiculosa]
MSRVRRKPPPSFPYSPKYPHPDPTDPYVPLRTLRERASLTNTSQHTSHDSPYAHLSPDREGFFLTVSPDAFGQGLDINYPPSSSDNHSVLTPPRIYQEHFGGYHSDSPIARAPRPLRSRIKPSRESRSYFSDLDLSSASPIPRHHDQHQKEKTAESDYHYRRRSRSVFIPRPQSQSQEQGDPPTADVSPSNASADAIASPHSDAAGGILVRQYTYDDRQSHGYLYVPAGNELDVEESPAPEVDAHVHSQPQSQRSATPSMTPDDTLSLSSTSGRDRSVSLSPRSLVRDLPRAVSKPVLRIEERKKILEQEQDTPLSAHGPIQTADFSILRSPTGPLPSSEVDSIVFPPSESHTESTSIPEPQQEQDGEQEKPKRGRAMSAGNREDTRDASRQSSFEAGRRRTSSNPGRRQVSRKPSVESESSLAISAALESVQVPADEALLESPEPVPENIFTSNAGPSSFPASFAHDHRLAAAHTLTKDFTFGRGSHLGGGESEPNIGSKSTRFIMHKPKKSLSYVSLGLSALPNVSTGPTIAHSANTSIGSAMTVGGGFGSIASLSREDLDKQAQQFFLLRPPPSMAAQPAESKGLERPPITERSARRVSSFNILDEDQLAAQLEHEFSSPAVRGQSTPAFTSLSLLDRPRTPQPLSPITSRGPSPVGNNRESRYQPGPRDPTPPPVQTFASPIPRIPAPIPRVPSPDNHRQSYAQSALPPPVSDSPPKFYISPIPPSEVLAPAPLPLSPPQPSEPPTPLPLPTPRTKSPVPRPPSRPRESQNTVPNVIRSVAAHDVMPTRSRSPPLEIKQRKRDTIREEERLSAYLPVAQLRPQTQLQVPQPQQGPTLARKRISTAQISAPLRQPTPPAPVQVSEPQPAPTLARKRISTAQVSAPVRQPTPPAQAQRQSRARSATPPPQPPSRSQSPSVETPYRSASAIAMQSRAQSPPPVPEFRAQSPPVVSKSRFRSPPPHFVSRAQSPPPRAPSRARSPTSSQDHALRRRRSREQSNSQLSRAGTSQSAGTQSSGPQNRRHDTAPSTPVPRHTTPSPTMTTHSQPSRAARRSRSQAQVPQRTRRHPQQREHQVHQLPTRNMRFDEYAAPTPEQLRLASSIFVVAQNGLRVQFGELFRERKTIVCFIRHFWCPNDQDYMYSIAKTVNPDDLRRAGIDLVIIGVGSPAMIKSYRQIFRMPFAVYTDPALRVHAALGMTRKTQDPGLDSERGEYVRHGPLGGLAMVVRNAIRVGMPVWEKGGDVTQLGGEFVFGPGPSCGYVHRMSTTRSHEPIQRILTMAGIRTVPFGPSGASRSFVSPDDEESWMEDRRRSFARMQSRREKRREGTGEQWRRENSFDMNYESDLGSGSVEGVWGTNMTREAGARSTEDDRELYSSRKRGFRVANPDQYTPSTPIEEHEANGDHGWDADVSDLPYLEGIGRTRAESYQLTQEVLAYSFGKR